MTLISTYINKYGIVLASDSNLTSKEGNSGFGQKVFPIPYLNAGLTYSGLYNIDGLAIDDWMNNFINESQHTVNSIEEIVSTLTNQLNSNFRGGAEDLVIIHICGYALIDFKSYLEHWHISNTNLDNNTGNYSLPTRKFENHNDFNSRTNLTQLEHLQMFETSPEFHQFYINGFPPARISLNVIKKSLEDSLFAITQQKGWQFRPPKNIFETANIVKMYFSLISELFKMSDYEAMFVGGETQTYLIPSPVNLFKG
jgi:hypothetical protein